ARGPAYSRMAGYEWPGRIRVRYGFGRRDAALSRPANRGIARAAGPHDDPFASLGKGPTFQWPRRTTWRRRNGQRRVELVRRRVPGRFPPRARAAGLAIRDRRLGH